MNQCTVCGQKGDQPHMCGGTPTLPGSEMARYASCHHFAVVMSDECPWCLKTKLEETLLQIDELRKWAENGKAEAMRLFNTTRPNPDDHARHQTFARGSVFAALLDRLSKTEKPKQEPKWSVCSCTEGMGVAVLCPVHGVEKRVEEPPKPLVAPGYCRCMCHAGGSGAATACGCCSY